LYLLIGITIVIIATACILFIVIFNRDPERFPLNIKNSIVAPADGKVIYVKKITSKTTPIVHKFNKNIHLTELNEIDEFINGYYHIGIYLSPFDIHVTRIPISGKVLLVSHVIGNFFSKDILKLKTIDERYTCIIKNIDITVGVIHMAAYLTRKIVLNIYLNQNVKIGQRMGRIKLGSQVDIIISCKKDIKVILKPGDKLRAGESIIAKIENG
jgi:phosphatidylserine decarboxylase